MNTAPLTPLPMPRPFIKLAFATMALSVAISAVFGISFALWAKHGADLFLAFTETGLSWCL